MRVPSHRPAATKYDFDPINRTMVPLTKEDDNQFGNLSLITTLREPIRYDKAPVSTVVSPPAFYDDDINKWTKKFEKANNDRKVFKRTVMNNTHFNILTKNENLNATYDLDKLL